MLFGILTPAPGGGFEVTLAGGGHPPALRLHDGEVEEIRPKGGMLVGALPDAGSPPATCTWSPGRPCCSTPTDSPKPAPTAPSSARTDSPRSSPPAPAPSPSS
nr:MULTISPECIES: SpoIIE family protein phosphatase [Pseudonocardiaceae]